MQVFSLLIVKFAKGNNSIFEIENFEVFLYFKYGNKFNEYVAVFGLISCTENPITGQVLEYVYCLSLISLFIDREYWPCWRTTPSAVILTSSNRKWCLWVRCWTLWGTHLLQTYISTWPWSNTSYRAGSTGKSYSVFYMILYLLWKHWIL